MLFVGFPFLMTFLKHHGFSSSGYTLIIGAMIIQWGMLVTGWISNAASGVPHPIKVKINIKSMLAAEFNTCTILITFATILGQASRVQYLFVAIVETVFFNVNEMILSHFLVISDAGGSVVIHMFGCYFGLAVAKAFERDETTKEESPKESSTYNSDLIAMLGTCILWALWPSFNSSYLGPSGQQARVIINTYLSLATSCVVTYIISPMLSKDGKLNMVHIQNATLAGGVAVGTASNLFLKPWVAMLSGFVGGFICMIAFHYLTPYLRRSAGIHDTCGVHNLHGLPGIFSGIVAAIFAATAEISEYGEDLYAIWPARAPKPGTAEFLRLSRNYTLPLNGVGRSKGDQAGMQLAAIAVTILIAIFGGLMTGYIATLLDTPIKDHLFDDKGSWEISECEEPLTKKSEAEETAKVKPSSTEDMELADINTEFKTESTKM
eukprot:gene4944-21286_t